MMKLLYPELQQDRREPVVSLQFALRSCVYVASAYLCLVKGKGFEPKLAGSQPAVLDR